MSADRNLLFGMLALHNGFIDREQLLAAMNGWMLAKQRSLREILRQSGDLSDDDGDDLDRLVKRHLQRHGDAQRSLAALANDAAIRRDLSLLPDADVRQTLATATPPCGSIEEKATVAATSSSRYRALHLHAQGGLGEVHVAEDEELHRKVALKQMQARYAHDAASRWRFVQEAEVTGNLEHPGIVPVYGLTADDAGCPVYAMRFIKGESLHDAIARFHQAEGPRRDPGERAMSLRDLLMRFIAMCNAVGYAHSRGVVHRDLKPANVMLGEYGETLVVDWGLARVLTQTSPEQTRPHSVLPRTGGDSTPTQEGETVGTPAVMPPEQARGEQDRVGPATDVWALGATLYAILTGKSPYSGDDALERAKACDFAPPRRLNPSVPRPLAAICRKAMEARPKERYPSARAMAEDVDRWLADEPVSVFRESLEDRLRRWGRRHRSLVVSGVVLLAASVIGLSIVLWVVNSERAKTTSALAQSEGNLRLAKAAVDECFNVVNTDPAFKKPQTHAARRVLLRATWKFYTQFRAMRPSDRKLQQEEADQFFRVGHIAQLLGDSNEAEQAYRRACELFAELIQANPDRPAYQQRLALSHKNLGVLLLGLGKQEEALREYEQADALLSALVESHADVPEYKRDLAAIHNNQAIPLFRLGRQEEAWKHLEQARRLQTALVDSYLDVPRYRNELAVTHLNVGMRLLAGGKRQDAWKEYEQALALQRALVEAHPEVADYQESLAATHNSRGILLTDLGKGAEAIAEYQHALKLRRALAHSHADVPQYQIDLAGACCNLGNLMGPAESLPLYDEAIQLLQALLKRSPRNVATSLFLRNSYSGRAGALKALGRYRQSIPDWDEALRLNTDQAYGRVARQERAESLARAGDHAQAAAEADVLGRAPSLTGDRLYKMACIYAASAAAQPLPAREKDVEGYARRAVLFLHRAAKAGVFRNPAYVAHLSGDAALDAIRQRDDYRAFAATLRAKP